MRVISIDPGYGRCGVAVVEGSASSPIHLYSDCIETEAGDNFFDRLNQISDRVQELVDEYELEVLAIEKLFFNQNTKTAMQVAQVKGAVVRVGKTNDLGVFEYTPQQIKTAVAGSGSARKQQVMDMTASLVDMPETAKHDDEYDAVAVGITCLAHEG